MLSIRGPIGGDDGGGWQKPEAPHIFGWIIGVILSYFMAVIFCGIFYLMGSSTASPAELQRSFPVEKRGMCPMQYRSGSAYCEPMGGAPLCVPKVGQCPGNMVQSGGYCCEVRYGRFRP